MGRRALLSNRASHTWSACFAATPHICNAHSRVNFMF